MDNSAEVAAVGVGVDEEGANVPTVVLAAREEYLPIAVTEDQAQAIRLGLEGESFPRPLTHDLLVEVLTEFGGALDRVRIDALADGTFYAKVDVQRYEEGEPREHTFDARPSDGIAVAARADCPILVGDEVLDAAGRSPSALDVDDERE